MPALSVLERRHGDQITKVWIVATRISACSAGMMTVMGRGQGRLTQLHQSFTHEHQ
jgi:hypothetical protein